MLLNRRTTSAGSSCSYANARSEFRSWPIVAAASTPFPTTSPTTSAIRPSASANGVVPVAADVDPGLAGQIAGGEGHALDLGQRLREDALLERLGDRPLALVADRAIESLAALAREGPGERALGRLERLCRSPAEQEDAVDAS